MKSRRLLFFLIITFLAMAVWTVYAQLYITKPQIQIIIRYNIDKFMHIVGGAFIMALLTYIFGPRKFSQIIISVLIFSAIWEIVELNVDKQVLFFYNNNPGMWVKDTVGDTLFAFVGAFAATRFVKTK